MKYSKKIIKESETLKFDDTRRLSKNNFEVIYKVSRDVNLKWHCTCFNAQFGTSQKRYCKHILGLMKFHDPETYKREIEEE